MVFFRYVIDGFLKGIDVVQVVQYVVMEKVIVVEVLKNQEEVFYILGQFFYGVGVLGDMKLEVMFLIVYYVQSFFVVIQICQFFSVLLNFVQYLFGGIGFYLVSFLVVIQEGIFVLQSVQVFQFLQTFVNGFIMQSLFIEEIYSVSVKNRAVFIEVEFYFYFL